MKRIAIPVLKVIVLFMGGLVLIGCIYWLPQLAEKASYENPLYAYLRYPVLFGLYATAIPFFIALFQAYKLLQLIKNGETFSNLAVNSLSMIRNCAAIILVIYIIGTTGLFIADALHPGILVLGVIIMFTTLTILLFAALLKELLRSAVEIKLENDLTV